ncbi:MAG: T9SS type A sorting domain-containing protein, partial [Endomicrobium sp.]|nr:T9SS type A sorting domain-containing protein [Endomicrobium sp.]
KLQEYINAEKSFNPASDNRNTYYAGKAMSKAANLIPVFHQAVSYNASNSQNRNDMITSLKNLLSAWYGGNDNNRYFGYNTDNGWYGIMGHPTGFGVENFNDHNFHYGYFVYASAMLAMFEPSFTLPSEYKGMVDLLIKDYANPPVSTGINDSNFPLLRCFDVYEGHSWASGFDPSANDGVNQESSSEAMNAWSAIILWGIATNNQKFIDLGVYGYTTEYAAIREYYFDTDATNDPANSNFAPYLGTGKYSYNSTGILWDNSVEYRVLWRNPYAAANPYTQEIKGIQVLPLTPSMLYLGYDTAYASAFYGQLSKTHGGLINDTGWWKSVWLRFKALFDAAAAVNDFENGTFPNEDEGSSKSFSYHFINFFNSLGQVDTNYYANCPAFSVITKSGSQTFIAFNESTSSYKNVSFYSRTSGLRGTMEVPPMTTVSANNNFTFFKYDSLRTILVSSQNYCLLADKYLDNISLSSCPVPFSDNAYYIDVQNAFVINSANEPNVTAFIKVDSAAVSASHNANEIKLYRYDAVTGFLSSSIPVQTFERINGNNILIRANIVKKGTYVLAIPTGVQPPVPFVINGTIKNSKNNSDVAITLYTYDTVTHSSSTQNFNGAYEVTVDSWIAAGRYVFTPINADYAFTPANFTNTASNQVINITAARIDTKVFAYPNPYKASRHGSSGVVFSNTKTGDRIRIYTVSGEKVFDRAASSPDFKWELINDYDYYVASGVYIYYIESQGKTYKGKLAIER